MRKEWIDMNSWLKKGWSNKEFKAGLQATFSCCSSSLQTVLKIETAGMSSKNTLVFKIVSISIYIFFDNFSDY